MPDYIGLHVEEIMARWPATIRVFIDHRMHCIGCPIGVFHTLPEAAAEHGIGLDLLERDIAMAIASARAGPARARRRSARGGGRP